MNLRQLETLLWTCRLGSVQKAARQLGTSQPAASARIRELEEHLGISLLMRDKRPTRITAQGREILRLAEEIIELAGRMDRYANAAHPIYGAVRLGANSGVASSWLPMLLRALYKELPGVEIELTVEPSDRLADLLRTGKIDIAFVLGRLEDDAMIYQSLYSVELEWAASHRLGGIGEPITPASISRFPILTDSVGSAMHRSVVNWFRAANVSPRRIDTCSGPLHRLNLALDGDWFTVVPTTVLPAYSRMSEFVRYSSTPALESMEMGVAYRAASDAGATIQHLLVVADAAIAQWRQQGRRVLYS